MSGTERQEQAAVPRFSVIITFHNQREFIKDAMESALSQQHAHYEIIVVDDASSDGSPEILQEYRDAVQLLCLGKNVGACAARNRGAAAAQGEYLVFLDGDDALLPWALEVYERIVAAKNPKIILAIMRWFSGTISALHVGPKPTEISIVQYGDYLRRDRGYAHSASATVIARQAFEEAHGWLVGFFPAGGRGTGDEVGHGGADSSNCGTADNLASRTWRQFHQQRFVVYAGDGGVAAARADRSLSGRRKPAF